MVAQREEKNIYTTENRVRKRSTGYTIVLHKKSVKHQRMQCFRRYTCSLLTGCAKTLSPLAVKYFTLFSRLFLFHFIYQSLFTNSLVEHAYTKIHEQKNKHGVQK